MLTSDKTIPSTIPATWRGFLDASTAPASAPYAEPARKAAGANWLWVLLPLLALLGLAWWLLSGKERFAVTAPIVQEFRVEEVASIPDAPPAKLRPDTIAFSDHRNDPITDARSGLISFVTWGKANPLQRRLLSLYPSYDEPTITATIGGVTKTVKRRLHMYVGEARFELARAPNAIDLAHYVNLGFLEQMDPAIKHQLISAGDVTPNKDGKLPNKHPTRRWCEDAVTVICVKSRYQQAAREQETDCQLHRVRKRAAGHTDGRD